MKKANVAWSIIVFGIFTLLPFLVLFFYNHPATDDYSCANLVKKYGFWGAQKYWYYNWKCSLVSSFIMFINPLIIKWFWAYKIIPFITFLIYIYLLYILVNTIARNSLKLYQKWAIVFAFSVSYLYYVPYVGHAFYWMPTIVSYQLPTIFVIIFLTILVKLKIETSATKKDIFILAVLVIIITQGSESYMAFILIAISLLLFLSTILHKHIDRMHAILFIVALVGAIIVLTSPGIYNRAMGEHPEINEPTRHVSVAFKFVFLEILHFISSKSLLMILFFVILLPIFETLLSRLGSVHGVTLLLMNPFMSFFVTIFFSSVFLFPMCYINQYHPFGRVSNIAYFYFLMGSFYTLFCLWRYFKQKYHIDLNGKSYKKIQWSLLFISVLMVLLPNNIRAAYADLLLGRASDYNTQLNKRYEMLAICKNDTCVVPPLRYATSLGFMDITTKTSAWENRAYSTFFEKKAIRLSEN